MSLRFPTVVPGPVEWTQATDPVVGLNHPFLTDTDNRALRELLSLSGQDPDTPYLGLIGSTGTVSASAFFIAPLTKEQAINAAIVFAVANNKPYVWLNTAMLGFNPALIVYNNATRLIREGQNPGVFDILAYGAVATLASDQTLAIQAAIDAQHAAQVGKVWMPAGNYAVTGLHYYSGSQIEGEGFVGPVNAPGTMLVQATAASKLLQPANSAVQTSGFRFVNFGMSSFGNAANLGGIDLTACTDFVVEDVLFNGCAVFGVQSVGGATPGVAGFGHLTRVIVNGHQAGAYGWVISSSAGGDQPDGLTMTDCRTSSGTGTWIHYVCVGGHHGPGSNTWSGCTFEAQGGNATADVTVDAAGAGPNLFVGCRFENTGTGGAQFNFNGFGIQPFAWFVGCNIAPGSGGRTWTDNGPVLSRQFFVELGDANVVLSQVYGLQTSLRTVTANTQLTYNDHTVLVDATAGNLTMTLPTPSASLGNLILKIKKIDAGANTVTVAPAGPNIDGSGASVVIDQQNQMVEFQTDGTNWFIVGAHGISPTVPFENKAFSALYWGAKSGGNYIQIDGTPKMNISIGNAVQYILDSSTFRPSAAAGKGLGTGALPFASLVLAISNLGSGAGFAPNCSAATTFIATANAAFTWNAPTNAQIGQRITLMVIQDATGGRTVAFNAVFKVTWSDTGNTAGKRSSISVIYDGTNWNQDGAQTPYV